jgi:hypothetical protein
MKREKKWKGGE